MSEIIKPVPPVGDGNEMKSTPPENAPKANVVALPKLRSRPHISTLPGDCAYQAALANGFKGTKDEWFASLGSM